MKVLMLDPDPVGYYGTDLCNSLHGRDVEIRLLTAEGFLHRDRLRCSFVEVAPHSGAGRWSKKLLEEMRYLGRLFQEAFGWRPDVVHVQWLRLPVELLAIATLRMLGFRIVCTAHNAVPHEGQKLATAVQALLYRMANELVVHTNPTRDEVADRFGVPRERIHVVPHGTHLEPRPSTLPQAEARHRLGLPDSGTHFLFFGQFRPYKGYEDLIAAFGEAARGDADIHLLLAGRAGLERAGGLRARTEALPASARARVHSFVAVNEFLPVREMETLFLASDCVVLPYTEISQSGVLSQAFGYGRSVIASRVGGFAEVIEHEQNGLLFAPGDVRELAGLLVSWGARREALADMGRRARTRALQEYSWERVAAATRDVYRSVMGAKEAA